jgi:hypothetical protein
VQIIDIKRFANTLVSQNTHIALATLYVPEASVGEYKTTAPLSSFANIVALEPEYLVGDVNGKGEIEIGDVTTILYFAEFDFIILPAGVTQIGRLFVTPSFWHEPNDQMARAKRSIGLSQTTKWLYRKIANEVYDYLTKTTALFFL